MTVELGEECAIGESMPIIGSLSVKDSALETEAVEHLVVVSPTSDLWVFNRLNLEHQAEIVGSGLVTLGGAHAGLKWKGSKE